MKPDRYSNLGMYGERDFAARQLKKGFTEAAFGASSEVNGYRIVGMFTFFHPDGRIVTQYTKKDYTGPSTVRGRVTEEFTREEFELFLQERQLTVGQRTPLAQLVEQWEV